VIGRGDLEGGHAVRNGDVPVAHNTAADLEHAQALRIELGVTEPGAQLRGVDRTRLAPRLAVDPDDCVDVRLLQRSEDSH
jgi:hypothetical protein